MEYDLPDFITELYGQKTTSFGNALLHTDDNYVLGIETLDEAESPSATSTELFLMGAHIVMNLGGSAYQYCD